MSSSRGTIGWLSPASFTLVDVGVRATSQRSIASAKFVVGAQARFALYPSSTVGVPTNEKPITSRVPPASALFMWRGQRRVGLVRPWCGSPQSQGFPVVEWAPSTAQLFEASSGMKGSYVNGGIDPSGRGAMPCGAGGGAIFAALFAPGLSCCIVNMSYAGSDTGMLSSVAGARRRTAVAMTSMSRVFDRPKPSTLPMANACSGFQSSGTKSSSVGRRP
jgi:hypothetical protein